MALMIKRTHREVDHENGYFKPNLDCNYTFTIDLAPNIILFGAKFIVKM